MSNNWYETLKNASIAPTGSDMDALLNTIWQTGVQEMNSPQIHMASTRVLEEQGDELIPSVQWLLRRLQGAGFFPSYTNYIGLNIFNFADDTQLSSPQIGKNTYRLIYDFLLYLLEIPQIQQHEHFEVLKKQVERIAEVCQEYVFPSETVGVYPGHIIKMTLLPESHVPEELVFMRVLQCTDLVFGTVTLLTNRAIEFITYGNALEAMQALHWATCLEKLLTPLLRPLLFMTIDSWVEIRPFIDRPSAIQSQHFHNLCARFSEIERIFNHPRVPESQNRYIALCQELATEANTLLQRWYKAHFRIADKYGSFAKPKSKGVQWLENQNPLTSKPEIPLVEQPQATPSLPG